MFCWSNRKKIIYAGIGASLLISLAACEKGKESFTFYPIDSLVSAQVVRLTSMQAQLRKEAVLGQNTDTTIYSPKDTSAWREELNIFGQLGAMNKPVNKGSYLVDDNLYDPGSNLTVKAFTSKDEDLPVRSLRIFYEQAPERPRKIEAVYNEENALYNSSRVLVMEFQQVNNKTLLTSYSVNGGQKMVLGDSVAFSVRGKIFVD
jgi:hypothetical protein